MCGIRMLHKMLLFTDLLLETRQTWNSYEDIDIKLYWSSEIMSVLLLYIVIDVTTCKKVILIHIIVSIINFCVL
jgi:hypothetical protein